ncbi:hypothetical protein CWE09_01015 [Aliidiomarina minuta]|uniref:Uncharacterized protein n=1 Tax=Aliidiomarina minuta TaxID=880057 RepID=A0A432W5K5_9GAMM|nr:pilus assembly protein N-terminal domain-containing protein [Aliidiomarina minuta]RUO25347.1 hypothetical protein CWE09_01015 [Aliidiomarina minuta]
MLSLLLLCSQLLLQTGGAQVLPFEAKIERLAIGNGTVLEARVLDNNELLILALQAGQSDLLIWSGGVKSSYQVIVKTGLDYDLRLSLQELQKQEAELEVSEHADLLQVGGQVSAQGRALLNQLSERYPQLLLALPEASSSAAVVIELEVRVMEFKKRHLRSLGVRWQQVANGPAVGIVSDWFGGRDFRVAGAATEGFVADFNSLSLTPGHYAYAGLSTALSSQLQLLEERGEVRMLASPVLRTESGSSAEFLAGGEVPLPQTNLQGAMEVNFKSYGIRLNIAPQQLDDGSIRTQVMTEVSNIDPAVSVGGIPGLLTRRTDSVVALPAGQTFVISGLTSEEASSTQQQVPGLGNLAAVGRLFANRDSSGSETELVIFITPRLVGEEDDKQQQREKLVQELQQRLQEQACRGMRTY